MCRLPCEFLCSSPALYVAHLIDGCSFLTEQQEMRRIAASPLKFQQRYSGTESDEIKCLVVGLTLSTTDQQKIWQVSSF